MDQQQTYQTYREGHPASNCYAGYGGLAPQPLLDDASSPISPRSSGYQQQEYQQQPYPFNDGAQSFVPPEYRAGYEYRARTQNTQSSESPFSSKSGNYAVLCYIGFWLTGFLFLIFERKNRLVRFHAMQSMLLFGVVSILYIVLIRIMIDQTPFVFGFAIFAFVIMNIVAIVSWFIGMIGAVSGKYTKLPLVGDIAERYVNMTTPTGLHL